MRVYRVEAVQGSISGVTLGILDLQIYWFLVYWRSDNSGMNDATTCLGVKLYWIF